MDRLRRFHSSPSECHMLLQCTTSWNESVGCIPNYATPAKVLFCIRNVQHRQHVMPDKLVVINDVLWPCHISPESFFSEIFCHNILSLLHINNSKKQLEENFSLKLDTPEYDVLLLSTE
jgi:hypothetical protein